MMVMVSKQMPFSYICPLDCEVSTFCSIRWTFSMFVPFYFVQEANLNSYQ